MNARSKARVLWDAHPTWTVLTGAGISTASGIGDYRDDSGQWKRGAPIMHQKFVEERVTRQRYWARSQKGYPQFSRAQPNAAHQTLVALENSDRVNGVITQNVDGLHQRAGQRNVVDLHGRLDQVVCLQCHSLSSRGNLQSWLERHNPALQDDFYTPAPDGDADLQRLDFSDVDVPQCNCGGILKPDVVFYGDSVPKLTVAKSFALVDEAQALLVLGTSLMVYSSYRFVRHASQQNYPILAINRGTTRGDELFTARLTEDCATGLAELVE